MFTTITSQNLAIPEKASDRLNSSLWNEVPCNLCGSRDVRIKFRGTTDPNMEKLLASFTASGNFVSEETLVECNRCQLVFTSPRLRTDIILKGYAASCDDAYMSQSVGRIKTFERSFSMIEKFKSTGSILDIGAASGFFLKVAKEKGWRTTGIEPSSYLADKGNRLYNVNIRCGTLESMNSTQGRYDVATLWDVLEHTFDPSDVLRRCNHLLNKDGLVVINYPNIGNWMAKISGRKFWFIISAHLYYFTPKTISAMLEKCGFSVVLSRPHFQWLDLGYLIRRAEIYLPRLAKQIGALVNKLGLEGTLIPYFAGQTCVIARKTRDI